MCLVCFPAQSVLNCSSGHHMAILASFIVCVSLVCLLNFTFTSNRWGSAVSRRRPLMKIPPKWCDALWSRSWLSHQWQFPTNKFWQSLYVESLRNSSDELWGVGLKVAEMKLNILMHQLVAYLTHVAPPPLPGNSRLIQTRITRYSFRLDSKCRRAANEKPI